MRLLIFACALLAAEAAPQQGYAPQRPGSTSATSFSSSRSDHSGSTGQTQSVGSISQTSVSGTSSFSAQSGQNFGQYISGSSQQSISGQSAQVSPVSSSQSSFNTQFSGAANTSPLVSNSRHSLGGDGYDGSCQEGQVRHFDGRCVTPEISRNVFVYAAPEMEPKIPSLPKNIPLPKIEHNIVFIRTQDNDNAQEPIIVPPPQKKHIIYVLNKESEEEQKVIEVPARPPTNPEVYFVNYADGETPTLPDGIDFETALNSAVHGQGQFIGGNDGLSTSDRGNTFVNEVGSNFGFGSGLSGTNAGVSFVGGSNVNGGNFVSGTDGSGNFATSVGGSQNFVTNDRFSGSSNNRIVGSTGNNFQVSPSVGTSGPQQFYTTP